MTSSVKALYTHFWRQKHTFWSQASGRRETRDLSGTYEDARRSMILGLARTDAFDGWFLFKMWMVYNGQMCGLYSPTSLSGNYSIRKAKRCLSHVLDTRCPSSARTVTSCTVASKTTPTTRLCPTLKSGSSWSEIVSKTYLWLTHSQSGGFELNEVQWISSLLDRCDIQSDPFKLEALIWARNWTLIKGANFN